MDNPVGVIGGLGPKATISFMKGIVDQTDASCDQDHLNILLFHHSSIPDRTAYILEPNDTANPLPMLLDDVKQLEQAGAAFIVIPCNTAHFFYDELQAQTEVPVVHMIRETVRTIKRENPEAKQVGILATEGTVQANLYQSELERVGLLSYTPPSWMQEMVNSLIFDQVKNGEPIDYQAYNYVLAQMSSYGCDVVILGCTELSYIEDTTPLHGFPVVDAQRVLVETTIERGGKKVKKPLQRSKMTS